MRFITLQEAYGNPVTISLEHVVCYRPLKEETEVVLVGHEKPVYVKVDYETFDQMVNGETE